MIDEKTGQLAGNLTTVQIYTYSIIDLMSFLSGLLLVWLYLRLRRLSETPGFLILMLCEILALQSFFYVYTAYHFIITQELKNDSSCFLHGILMTYLVALSWNIALCLAIELLLQINMTIKNDESRLWYYQTTSYIGAFGFTLPITITGGHGLSINGVCSIMKDSWGNLLMWVFYLYLPIYLMCGFSIIVSYIKNPRKKIAIRNGVLLLVFVFLSLPYTLEHLIAYNFPYTDLSGLKEFAIICRSFIGLIVCIIRSTDSEIRETAKKMSRVSNIMDPLLENDLFNLATVSILESVLAKKDIDVKEMENDRLKITLLCLSNLIGKIHTNAQELHHQNFPWPDNFYNDKIDHEIVEADITNSELPEDQKKKCKNNLVQRFNCKVVEYAPMVFFHILSQDGISQSDIIQNLKEGISEEQIDLNLSGYPTRSLHNSPFHTKYLLREISDEELEMLLSSLPKIHKYITEESHNKSLVVRVLGLFSFFPKSKHPYNVILLENIVPPDAIAFAFFELKGTKLNRQVLSDPSTFNIKNCPTEYLLKDLDFCQIQQNIYLSYYDQTWLKLMIENDVQFLKEMGSSEYSLFLTIAPSLYKEDLQHRYGRHVFSGQEEDKDKIYILGIMDIYINTKKKSPKTPRIEESPDRYAARFLSFFESIIKCDSL